MQEDKRYQEEFYDIHVLDIIWSVLRCWRGLLVSILVFGSAVGGFCVYREYKDLTDSAVVKKRQTEYNEALEEYELEKSKLEKKLENLEETKERQQYYLDHSIMLKVDQYNVYLYNASYFIDAGYQIAPELFYQNPNFTGLLTNTYKSAIDKLNLDEVLNANESSDLTVLNPNGGSKKLLTTSVDAGNGILNVKVQGDTQERVEQIVAAVNEVISNEQQILNRAVKDEHTLNLIYEKYSVDVDPDFGKIQTEFDDKMTVTSEGIEDTQKKLEELKEPVDKTPTKKSVLKKGIKYGLIGLAVGLFISFAYCFIRVIIRDKVNCAEDIRRRYDAPLLGTYISGKKKLWKIDKAFAKKLGMNAQKEINEQIGYICSNIKLYSKNDNKLLLVGNCKDEELTELKDKITEIVPEREVAVAGNVNDNADAITALFEDVDVICVEKWTVTSHKEVRNELQTVKASGRLNLGFILID